MQKIPAIIISCLLLSCSSFKGEQGKIYDKLQEWDKILYEKPEEIVDSLATLSLKDMSKKNRAYYSLLYTIARNKVGITETDDSVISVAVEWYKNKKVYRNTCRSILYRGLVIDRTNRNDSLLYYKLLEAERTFYNKNVQDNDFKCQIYTLLGRIYLTNRIYSPEEIAFDRTHRVSEEYIIKSLAINNKLSNKIETQKAKLELSQIKVLQKKDKEALAILNSFGDLEQLSPFIRYNLYRAYYYYIYSQTSLIDHEKAIFYLHKIIEIRKKNNRFEPMLSHFYRLTARSFLYINKVDSSLFYAKLAVKTAEEANEKNSFVNYKLLADIYASVGDFKSANENSKEFFTSYLRTSSLQDTKLLRKTKFELSEVKDILKREKSITKILTISSFLLVACFSLIIIRSRKKNRRALKELAYCQNQIADLDDELKKTKFIKLLHETLVGALPRFIDDINKQASRSRKYSHELSDDLNSSINSIRSHTKSNFSAITHTKSFLIANPNVKYLISLSDMEIIILVLFDLKFNSKEIADLLNTTQSSVRAIKTRIKEKILLTEGLPFNPENTFRIFSKDQNQRS